MLYKKQYNDYLNSECDMLGKCIINLRATTKTNKKT